MKLKRTNTMSNRNTPVGSYSNYHRRVAERDVDIISKKNKLA